MCVCVCGGGMVKGKRRHLRTGWGVLDGWRIDVRIGIPQHALPWSPCSLVLVVSLLWQRWSILRSQLALSFLFGHAIFDLDWNSAESERDQGPVIFIALMLLRVARFCP